MIRTLVLWLLTASAACGAGFPIKFTSSPINVSVAQSRIADGVHDVCRPPCAVFFDASATTAPSVTSLPFHEIQYSWTFGDAVAGAAGSCGTAVTAGQGYWSCGGNAGANSKNAATGPVAGHVFESAGSYTVTATIYDGTHTVTQSIPVVVTAWPADTTTVCVANGSAPVAGSDGCPTGAAVHGSVTTWAGALAYAVQNARVLLKHDDTFTVGTTQTITAAGPGMVGMYGSGAKPVIQATADSIKMLQFGTAGAANIADWRVVDLDFEGNTHTGVDAVEPIGGINQLTELRLVANAVYRAFSFNDSNLSGPATIFDQIATVDSVTSNMNGGSAGSSALVQVQRYMLMGNSFDQAGGGEHTVRLQYGNYATLNNNTLQGAPANKHALTIRARSTTESVGNNAACVASPNCQTQYIEVSDNKFIAASASYAVFYGPQDSTNAERVVNVITERNWFTAGTSQQYALVDQGQYQTIRNNVFDTSTSQANNAMLANSNAAYNPAAWGNHYYFYNNTIYSSANPCGNCRGVDIDVNTQNVLVANTLVYWPHFTATAVVTCGQSSTLTTCTANGLTTATNTGTTTTDPKFTSVSPFTPANAKITAGSYAIGGGTSEPVWSDLLLTSEPSPRDMGAVSH